MSDTITTVLAIALIFVGLPLLVLKLRDRVSRVQRDRRNPPEAQTAARHAYERRILTPDWECVQRHLKRPVPQALRELYADGALVTSQDLQYSTDHSISTFEALDEQTITDASAWLELETVVFATTATGDPIYLRSGSSEGDTVYLTYHDGGDTDVFAASVAQLLQVLRQASR
jgi:SMI1/KNR4 family protein SUKH-1